MNFVMEEFKVNYHALTNAYHGPTNSAETYSIISKDDTTLLPMNFPGVHAEYFQPGESQGYADIKNDGTACLLDLPRYDPVQAASCYATQIDALVPTLGYAPILSAGSEPGNPIPLQPHDYAAVPSPRLSSIPLLQTAIFAPSEQYAEPSSQTVRSGSGSQPSIYPQDHNLCNASLDHSRSYPPPTFHHTPVSAPTTDFAGLDNSTSPDERTSATITAHEKRRQYLECLEQYVLFLHQHCEQNGIQPGPIERIAYYRGLNNNSMQMLLVHALQNAEQMRERLHREEQRFELLSKAVQSLADDSEELTHAV
ncbi:hypothetical protein NP233_g8476 [Leucocoprinus birnbaumii]|uniref:Uncharacterized protein n=1 Tax=Leucocoprinus birnbaumii TaxID=56174 RepID=A0AAD5VQV4_9AGAR|nr:hypothetical protein NP233_g8476 [Leucocoprinus birnbaumii]